MAPAIEASEDYGAYEIVPALVGFIFGAAFVYGSDLMLPHDTVALLAPSKPQYTQVEPSQVVNAPREGLRQRKNG